MRLGPQEKIMLAEAVLLVFAAKMALKVLPFKTIVRLSGRRKKDNAVPPDPGKIIGIKQALRRSGRLAFRPRRCLVLCLAGKWMASGKNIPSTVHLGAAFGENHKMIPHAWLTSGNLEIVPKNGDYFELYRF